MNTVLLIFAILSVILLMIVLLLQMRESAARYCTDTNFEPISDDEFFARCKPGTNRAVALGVRRIVSEQLAVDYDTIHPEHRFVEDLRAD